MRVAESPIKKPLRPTRLYKQLNISSRPKKLISYSEERQNHKRETEIVNIVKTYLVNSFLIEHKS